mmetsp:Transcript_74033/g.239340  ORF Transcript_74033/g.239340 Transcript_74033/m.239340 type:complete len:307 (-) Transcript_74033:19-939(-)
MNLGSANVRLLCRLPGVASCADRVQENVVLPEATAAHAVGTDVLAHTVPLASNPLAVVGLATRPREPAFAVLLVVKVLALVDHGAPAVAPLHAAPACEGAAAELASVDAAVRPALLPLAVQLAVAPVAHGRGLRGPQAAVAVEGLSPRLHLAPVGAAIRGGDLTVRGVRHVQQRVLGGGERLRRDPALLEALLLVLLLATVSGRVLGAAANGCALDAIAAPCVRAVRQRAVRGAVMSALPLPGDLTAGCAGKAGHQAACRRAARSLDLGALRLATAGLLRQTPAKSCTSTLAHARAPWESVDGEAT